ncbi:MAG: TonB-dependent receptor plug domain-containing protein [Campylobacter sp.]
MKGLFVLSCAVLAGLNAEVFKLGQVEVTQNIGGKVGDSSVEIIHSDKMQKDEIKRLSDISRVISGVYADKGGARAENNLYVRGFNARRVPMFIDGIPVYIPYDGNIDAGRFTTFDLSRIDVSKGASSVLYGANTMGGAINLITKKPMRELEGSIGYGFETGKNSHTAGNNVDFNIGSKQEKFYIQASASFIEDQGEQLSAKFKKSANEDGKRRENSVQRDKKIGFKIGFTPNQTDEYAITYMNQKASKEQPLYAGKGNFPRFWDWPRWDKESVYFLSHMQFEKFYLNTKAFYDTFNNDLYAQKPTVFDSYYRDKSYGGGSEFGMDLGDKNTLKMALSYKFDQHKEHNNDDPVQKYKDKTYTFALEDSIKFTDMTKLIFGVSYDTRDAKKAQAYKKRSGAANAKPELFDFEVGKENAFNYQAILKHSFDNNDELSFSYAKKTYFPSMKERYSYGLPGTKRGKVTKGKTPNPDLKPEIAYHYEIGYDRNFSDIFRLQTALFYSKMVDAIAEVDYINNTTQNQNVDKAAYKGFELGTTYFATPNLEIGGNYTFISAKYKGRQNTYIYDFPKHKGFIYADYKIAPKFDIYISQELASKRYEDSAKTLKLSGFGVTNLKFGYEMVKDLRLEAGINNMFDKNYEYTEGYPQEGRIFYANLRYKF